MELSIIIPAYNRKETLKRCLLSLDEQDYSKDKYEIIIVDDGSSDDIPQMIDALMQKYKNLRYIQQLHKGPACARNLGIKEAKGKIIGFTDDDCTLDRDWVKLMVESHKKNPEIITVGGLTETPYKKTSIMVGQFLSNGAIQTNLNKKKEIIFFPTCNVSFKRRIFDKYTFNERFSLPGGEDLEFFWRLFKHGHRFIWNKNIKVLHYRNDTLNSFIRQACIYGRGNLLTQCVHKDHPLLKELKTGKFSFWIAILINIIKIPRFSYSLGRRLIKESNVNDIHKKISIYSHFVLHKIFYIAGNVLEFIRISEKSLKREKKPFCIPRLLILDITHSCNLSCRICDIWKTANRDKDIPISYIKKILSQTKGVGIKEITLSGGEPLLRKDIFEILDYTKTLGIKNLGILSNGVVIEEYLKRLTPYLVDNTISPVISLDSVKPQIHNAIRNSDISWQKTVKGLELLAQLKKEYPRVNFNAIVVILNQNLEELLELTGLILSLGANSLQFQALLPNNLKMTQRNKSLFWIPKERFNMLDEIIDGLIEFKKENPCFVRNSIKNLSCIKKYFRGIITSEDVKCISAKYTILVSNQGESRTCFSSYGNIKKQDLEDILQSRQMIKARERVAKCSWPCLLPCFCDPE
ncbi:glycosyltransferase [Patescibacteria group bacterium]|nr:glycosyltransferase [Patescibacteria group bacterium]